MFSRTLPEVLSMVGLLCFATAHCGGQEVIDVWYGLEQHFGSLGQAQRWLNVLGSVGDSTEHTKLTYRINDAAVKPLTLGSDLHRLARPGDFNIELAWNEVRRGSNQLMIYLDSSHDHRDSVLVKLHVQKGQKWPLPYNVNFSEVDDLQSVVQVIDGKWKLTASGVRTVEPYYDRVLSMGDTSWRDYEVLIELTVHGWTPSEPGPPTYNVTHFGTALRWRGHHRDGRQPSRKWYPLGAQGEFLLKESHDSCQWRILFDGGGKQPKEYGLPHKKIQIEQRLQVRAAVQTTAEGKSQYQFRQWMSGDPEPDEWDVVGWEEGDYPSGALCLVPHNSDVTIHRVEVNPITK